MAAKAFLAHEKMMETWHKEKRVLRTDISFKALKLDHRLQARAEPLDLDQVKELHGYVKDGADLAPITVFRIDGKDYCGNGFHRSEVYRKEKRPSIKADVILDATWQEAVEFATCCNMANSALTPTKEDRKKAVFMLLDAGWDGRSASEIARHVVVDANTVIRWRAEWCEKNGKPLPKSVVTRSGQVQPAANRKKGEIPTARRRTDGFGFLAYFNGKRIHLPVGTKEEAAVQLQKLTDGRSASLSSYGDASTVARFLAGRGVHYDGGSAPIKSLSGGECRGFAFTYISEDLRSTHRSVSANLLITAVGRAMLLAEHHGLVRKVVLAHNPIEGHETIVDLAGRLGIEFMTLDQFVEAVKAKEGEGNHTEKKGKR